MKKAAFEAALPQLKYVEKVYKIIAIHRDGSVMLEFPYHWWKPEDLVQ